MTEWRNRITGHGQEAPDQLLANPRNWRVHPKAQQEALAAVLDQVGWVQDVIVNQRTGHVVDGHARIALMGGVGRVRGPPRARWRPPQSAGAPSRSGHPARRARGGSHA